MLRKTHNYYGQVQLGMSLLNLQRCLLVIYASFDNSYAEVEVDFDYEFTKTMMLKVKKNFFANMWHILCQEGIC